MFNHCREPKNSAFVDWKPTIQEKTRYLNLNMNPHMVNEEMPFYSRLAFWDKIIGPVKDEL